MTLEKVVPPGRARIYPYALGEARGTLELRVSAHDDSSSLLPIGEAQTRAFPGTEEVDRVRVEVRELNEFLIESLPRPLLLKIDVQGYELAVLAGAAESLARVDQALIECSFVELYDGQPLADKVICKMHDAGFGLSGVSGIVSARDGACLQADLLFNNQGTDL